MNESHGKSLVFVHLKHVVETLAQRLEHQAVVAVVMEAFDVPDDALLILGIATVDVANYGLLCFSAFHVTADSLDDLH